MSTIQIEVKWPARDEVRLSAEINDQGEILSAHLVGLGCRELLELLAAWRPKLQGTLAQIPLPPGTSHAAMILREVLLKAQGRWQFPYAEEELCHCRAVPTARVDQAIVGGCHSVQAVREATSANTSCGTCLPDVQSVLAYRLGRLPKSAAE